MSSSSSSSSSSASSSSTSSFSLPPRLVSVSQPYSTPLTESAPTPTIPIINTAFPYPSSLSPSDAHLSVEPLTSAAESLRMSARDLPPATESQNLHQTTANGILPRRGLGKLPLFGSQILSIPEGRQDEWCRKIPVQLKLNGALNALAASPDMDFAVVAGREVLKILAINDHEIKETVNLRIGSRLNLNFSSNDVKWGNGMTKQKIATAATNGAVVIWDLTRANQKLERIISEHTRAVNRICFHPSNGSILLSGSQDGTMKIWDLRVKSHARFNFEGKAESVRDVQFNGVNPNEFAAAFENGTIQRWDIRNPNNYERKLSAHNGLALTVDWHSDGRLVASGGRDRMIMVWDMKSDSRKPVHQINTIASVARVSWRPGHDTEIASCSLLTDCRVHIWDVRRPYISKYHLDEHESVPTGVLWTDQDVLWTCAKDRYVVRHEINCDTYRPLDHLSGMGMAWNMLGDLMSVTAGRGSRGEERLDVWEENFHPSLSPGILPTPSSALSSTSSGGLAGIGNTTQSLQRLNKGNGSVVRKAGTGTGSESRPPPPPPRQVSSILNLPVSFRPDPFILMAQNYSIDPTNLRHSCERNSLVAWTAGEYRASQTWRIVEMLFDGDSRDAVPPEENDPGTREYEVERTLANESKEDEAVPTEGPEGGDGDIGGDEGRRATHTMSSTDAYLPIHDYASLTPARSSENSDETPFYSNNIEGASRRRKKFFSNFMGDEDGEEEEEEDKILPTRDSDLQEASVEEGKCGESENVSFDPASRPRTTTTTTSSSLYPKWNHKRIVQDLLVYYAERGDVQMCVTLRLVLGDRAEIPDHVLGHKEEEWFWSYIDLLHRFRLYSASASIISACRITSVRQRNQESTTIHTTCNNCFKALLSKEKRGSETGGFWMCESCRKLVNPCSLCHQTVRGLYVWCQGCSHGGHLRCLQEWFEEDAEVTVGLEDGNCPTGCGHVCVYRRSQCVTGSAPGI